MIQSMNNYHTTKDTLQKAPLFKTDTACLETSRNKNIHDTPHNPLGVWTSDSCLLTSLWWLLWTAVYIFIWLKIPCTYTIPITDVSH